MVMTTNLREQGRAKVMSRRHSSPVYDDMIAVIRNYTRNFQEESGNNDNRFSIQN